VPQKLDGEDPVASARQKKPRIQTAERAISVVLLVSNSLSGLRAKDISEELGLPRQVTYHLLHTLLNTGILRKTAQNCYVLGLAAGSIAEGFRRHLSPPELVVPKIRAIVAATGETSYASGWVDGQIVVLATARGRAAVQAAEVPHGFRGHAHARATGKLLLALTDAATREAHIRPEMLIAVTDKTITNGNKLREEMKLIAERGYSVDEEEFSLGLCCLAVPLVGFSGAVALGISVPTERFHARFEEYLTAVQHVARGIETGHAMEANYGNS